MGSKTSAQFGKNWNNITSDSFSFRDFYIKESDIILSSKQLSKITSSVDLRFKAQQNLARSLRRFINNDKKQELLQREIELKKSKEFLKCNTLFDVGESELDNIRNNFPRLLFNLNKYEDETQSYIRKEHINQYNLNIALNGYSKPIQKVTPQTMIGYLWHNNPEAYKMYMKLKREVIFVENNLAWAEAYFDLFKEKKQVTYLQTSINLLKSATKKKIVRSAESGFRDSSVSYFSRNRFCAYSQAFKSLQQETQILETLKYWDKRDFTASFLTLSPKNISNLCKEDILCFSKILKDFFRDKEISQTFKGYYGFLEIKEKQNQIMNMHIHITGLRKKDKSGYIDKRIISKKFEEYCNKSNNDKLKGSKIIDIQKIEDKVKGKDIYGGAVRYIHQYITKGIDVFSPTGRKTVIEATDGVRFLRSGGLLSLNTQKDIATQNYVDDTFLMRDYVSKSLSGLITTPMNLGGKDFIQEYIQSKFFGLSNDKIIQNMKCDKDSWKTIKDSIFTVEKQLCPFSNLPLKFSKTIQNKSQTNYHEPLFQLEALELLGLDSQKRDHIFNHCFPKNMNSIYRNDCMEDVFLLGGNY